MRPRLFAYGFRTFFFAAGSSALLLVPIWAARFSFHWPLGTDWPPASWHGHEMLFGFVCAAIAGFLLTAVPSWTGRKGFGGAPLMLMSAVWLLGRLAAGSSASWPFAVVAAADLAFLPVLAAFLAPPLIRENNRNTPLLLVLLILWLCNAAFHLGLFRGDVLLARQALLVGIDVVLILVTVIGGRITPSFTASALRQRGVDGAIRAWPGLTAITIALMIAVAAVDLLQPNSAPAGWVAFAAALAQGARLMLWQGHRTHLWCAGALDWLPGDHRTECRIVDHGIRGLSRGLWAHPLRPSSRR